MRSRFFQSLRQLGFSNSEEPILVAVSGGVDSMALLNLFYESDYQIGVAHCNYQLRAENSAADEELVCNWCVDRNIPFHLKKVQTQSLAQKSGSSIQMIARNERYQFFKELIVKNGYKATALAHHADDRVESLVLNVLRGTGFRGFQGMPSQRDDIIRPLLGFRKDEIRAYAKRLNIPFREDASNQQTYYQRNWVRLKLIPMLECQDSSAVEKLLSLCERSEKELPSYTKWVDEESSLIKKQRDKLSIDAINTSKAPFTVLKEILEPNGFNSDLVFEVMDILDSKSGAEVHSETHRVTKDREQLILSLKKEEADKPALRFETFSVNQVKSFKTPSNIALLDADKIDQTGLEIRKWAQGDKFKPLGMDRWKLLSDFFIDQKLSVPEKERTWLLTQDDETVWVLGHRIDNRFKISNNTQKVLKVTAQV